MRRAFLPTKNLNQFYSILLQTGRWASLYPFRRFTLSLPIEDSDRVGKGLSYQKLIDLYLLDCAKKRKKLIMKWVA
jgi:hypothetical protein